MLIRHRLASGAVALALAAPVLTACGGDDGGTSGATGPIEIEASFYPLAWIAERVGGEHVAVRSLAKAGAEPHDLELSPSDVADVLDADLVVYLDGFQPAVDDAVDQVDRDRRFDAADAGADLDLRSSSDGHDDEPEDHEDESDGHEGVDPHFWLDPTRLAAVAGELSGRLAELDPAHADEFTANATALQTALSELDSSFATGLANCARRALVTSHSAFAYLARRYELTQVGITGLSPEEEPSPADLAELADYVRDHDVRTIFYESLVSPAIAEVVAGETGAATDLLDPIEGLDDSSRGGDYLQVMTSNLEALRAGLECT